MRIPQMVVDRMPQTVLNNSHGLKIFAKFSLVGVTGAIVDLGILNALHFFVWQRLGPCCECKENRQQKCKQNCWAAQEWGCASVGEESAASVADSGPRNQIRGGGLHVRHQEGEPLPQSTLRERGYNVGETIEADAAGTKAMLFPVWKRR